LALYFKRLHVLQNILNKFVYFSLVQKHKKEACQEIVLINAAIMSLVPSCFVVRVAPSMILLEVFSLEQIRRLDLFIQRPVLHDTDLRWLIMG
jgi:hypothetical protein